MDSKGKSVLENQDSLHWQLKAKVTCLSRYKESKLQEEQNKPFHINQKLYYNSLKNKEIRSEREFLKKGIQNISGCLCGCKKSNATTTQVGSNKNQKACVFLVKRTKKTVK